MRAAGAVRWFGRAWMFPAVLLVLIHGACLCVASGFPGDGGHDAVFAAAQVCSGTACRSHGGSGECGTLRGEGKRAVVTRILPGRPVLLPGFPGFTGVPDRVGREAHPMPDTLLSPAVRPHVRLCSFRC
ncbi:MAG: hypothetical protein HPZ91_02305 [Lentisphaeria bacterium]|nr:hypothetical protein [Lentisphaeria bacterium]